MATYDLRDGIPASTDLKAGDILNAPYNNTAYYAIYLPPGQFTLEVWGCMGRYLTTNPTVSRGGYSKGTLTLQARTRAYLVPGSNTTDWNRINGGNDRGGDASDIRLLSNSINNRILVAGGGGGTYELASLKNGGYGGGTTGGDGANFEEYPYPYPTPGKGGTQTAGGNGGTVPANDPGWYNGVNGDPGTFGSGGKYGGGGGWYGGGGAFYNSTLTPIRGGGAGGGSGFALTSSSVANVPSSYSSSLKNSKYYLTNTQLIAGNASMPNPSGGTMTGSQNGYVRITVVSVQLTAVTNLTASEEQPTSVKISWTGVSGITGVSYDVYRGSTKLTTTTSTSYTDTGISPGKTYTFKVIATKSGYTDSAAATLSFTNKSRLSKPSGLTATYTVSNTKISWTAVEGATGYIIWRDSTQLTTRTSTSYTDSSSGYIGSTHTYKVSATDSTGAKYDSTQASISTNNNTPLPTPTNLTASNLSVDSVTLSWTMTGYDFLMPPFTFKVYRDSTLLVSVTEPTFTDGSISPGKTYTYQVIATKTGYTNSAAASVSVTNPAQLATPSGLSFTYTQTSTKLSWTAPTGTNIAYKVWRGSTLLTSSPITAMSYTDSTAGKATSYTYYVSAVDTSGVKYESAKSSKTSQNPSQLATPTNGNATYTQSATTISWKAVTNATAYKIYRGSTLIASANSTTSYTDTSAGTGSSYTYKVSATASGYYESGQLSISTSNSQTLATPTGLSSSCTVSSTTISWNAVTNATAYKVYRGTTLLTSTLTATTYTDTASAAGAGKTNTYKISATASGYYESAQASISVTNKAQYATPTGLTASYTQSSTTISWGKVTSPGTATVYNVWRGNTSLGQVTSSAATISYTDSSSYGAAGKSNTYYVTAAGPTSYYESAKASIKTSNPSTLATPSGLKASYTQSATTITWTAVTSATSYKIFKANTQVATVNTNSYTDSSASAGSGSITYKVVASNSPTYWDSSAASINTSNPTALSPVTNLTAAQTVSSVTLTWSRPSGATSYTVQRGTANPVTVTSSASSVSYTDNTTQPGTTYTYKVIAKASGKYDSSATSVTVTVHPRFSTPTIAEAYQTENSVTLSITRTSSSGTLQLLRDGAAKATSSTAQWTYTDTGLIPKTSYVYTVYTVGNSSYYDSLPATVTVYIGKDYTQIERQRAYLSTLTKPFFKLCRLRFLYPNGTTAYALDNNPKNRRSKAFIQDGTVNANMQNGQRLTASVTIANADHAFDFNINHIWFGQDVALDEGLILPNGEEYWRQTGVFVIDNPTETVNPNTRTATYNLVDKWADLDGTLDGNLEGTYEVAVGTNIYTPIAALLSESRGNGRPVDLLAPVFTEYFNSRTQALPDGTTASMVLSPYTLNIDGDGGTIGEVVLGLAGMVNAWAGYDNTGRLRIEPSQDDILDAQKAVLYRFRPEEVTLLGLAYTIKKEDLFNDYIVVGEQMDDYSQPGGRAQNLDPRSDTNINIIGRKTKRESASGYATVQQCKDLAEWRLKRSGVLQKAVNISCSQIFHIELNSLVEIVRTDKEGSPTERHLIQGYSRPLATNGPMNIQAVSVNDFPIATVSQWPPA